MRHAVFGRQLSRDTKARKSLLNNLADSLFLHGSLTTTVAKAKFAAPYVEKMVTLAKKEKLNANRQLASLISPSAFKRLIQEIAPGFTTRNGGYTKITKLFPRKGDNSQMAKIELLPFASGQGKDAKQQKPKKALKSALKTAPKAQSKTKKSTTSKKLPKARNNKL